MAQYINKTDVMSEIKRIKKNKKLKQDWHFVEFDGGYLSALDDIKVFLDTLEVKEVDLEKEINNYISNNFFGSETVGFYANRTKEEPNDQDIALCAKHFFELGFKAQKGEQYDRQSTENQRLDQ